MKYSDEAQSYIDSVGGSAHQSAIDAIESQVAKTASEKLKFDTLKESIEEIIGNVELGLFCYGGSKSQDEAEVKLESFLQESGLGRLAEIADSLHDGKVDKRHYSNDVVLEHLGNQDNSVLFPTSWENEALSNVDSPAYLKVNFPPDYLTIIRDHQETLRNNIHGRRMVSFGLEDNPRSNYYVPVEFLNSMPSEDNKGDNECDIEFTVDTVKIIVYENHVGVNVSCKYSADTLISNPVPFNADQVLTHNDKSLEDQGAEPDLN